MYKYINVNGVNFEYVEEILEKHTYLFPDQIFHRHLRSHLPP